MNTIKDWHYIGDDFHYSNKKEFLDDKRVIKSDHKFKQLYVHVNDMNILDEYDLDVINSHVIRRMDQYIMGHEYDTVFDETTKEFTFKDEFKMFFKMDEIKNINKIIFDEISSREYTRENITSLNASEIAYPIYLEKYKVFMKELKSRVNKELLEIGQ